VNGLTKISKIFAFSAPFSKLSSILHRIPNSVQNSACTESQNPVIPNHSITTCVLETIQVSRSPHLPNPKLH